eukprot:5572221-Amphidinium_carterae.2
MYVAHSCPRFAIVNALFLYCGGIWHYTGGCAKRLSQYSALWAKSKNLPREETLRNLSWPLVNTRQHVSFTGCSSPR